MISGVELFDIMYLGIGPNVSADFPIIVEFQRRIIVIKLILTY